MAHPVTYNDCPQFHPLVVPLRARRFPYSWDMVPSDFRIYYHACPVELPGGDLALVAVLRYVSNAGVAARSRRDSWVGAVRAHAGAGISPLLSSWLGTSRPMAVFNGHGLPEEISLVCQLAVSSGLCHRHDLQDWVRDNIGLDCNGFVNAYYMSIGTFNRVMHYHPKYVQHGARAVSNVQVDWDSCMVWAWKPGTGPGEDKTGYRVRANPGNDAHIAVIERWLDFGQSLIVVERGGNNRFPGRPAGLTRSIYTVVTKPPAGVKAREAGWEVRSEFRNATESVIITKRMPTY